MSPLELAKHKRAPKRLVALPTFKAMSKSGKKPRPFHKMGGARVQWTDIQAVSDVHRVVFLWCNGEARTDAAFFAYLFCVPQGTDLYPLAVFHFHPSHKGGHVKMPCDTELDYLNRELPHAPELAISGVDQLDPREPEDRLILIHRFCKAVGIEVGDGGGLWH